MPALRSRASSRSEVVPLTTMVEFRTRIATIFSFVSFVPSAASVWYSLVLLERIFSGGASHLGGDVIAIAYLAAGSGFFWGNMALVLTINRRGTKSLMALAAFGGTVALLIWGSMHFNGMIVSHGSMFVEKFG